MSSRGVLSNKLYVDIRIPFDYAWDDLSDDEKKLIISSNIDMLETEELISELEARGFCVTEEE